MGDGDRQMRTAAIALVVVQVLHALTPAETDAEGYAGLVGGLVLLVAALAAVYGLALGRGWGRRLAGVTGLTVAVGFTLYHVVPFSSPVTNPYLGEGVGVAAWASVAASVAVGLWCARAAGLVGRERSDAAAAT